MTLPAEMIAKASQRSIVEVAMMLGVGAKGFAANPERGVPCPGCGGTDRFSANPRKNVFQCRNRAGGNPIDLVRHVQGCSFVEAVRVLCGAEALSERDVAADAIAEARKADFRREAQKRAWWIWGQGRPAGALVRAYLGGRGIPFPRWRVPALREHPNLRYHHRLSTGETRVLWRGPAMLAAITGPDGRFIGVHRTWVDPDRPGRKAEIVDPETGELLPAKKVEGSQRTGKIVIRASRAEGAPEGRDSGPGVRSDARPSAVCDAPSPREAERILKLGEGIETVLSHEALFPGRADLWSGINLFNLAGKATESVPHPSRTQTDRLGRVRAVKVPGPDPDMAADGCLAIAPGSYDRLILLGDGDSDLYTTGAAMLRAERRHGHAVSQVTTDWAPSGQDWNDRLRQILADHGERRRA